MNESSMTQFRLIWWTQVWIRFDLLKVKNRIKRKCSTDFKNVLDFHILNKHKMNKNVIHNNNWRFAYICMYKSDTLRQDFNSVTCNYRYSLELKNSKWDFISAISLVKLAKSWYKSWHFALMQAKSKNKRFLIQLFFLRNKGFSKYRVFSQFEARTQDINVDVSCWRHRYWWPINMLETKYWYVGDNVGMVTT